MANAFKNKKVDLFFSGQVMSLPFLKEEEKIKKDFNLLNNFKIICNIS